MQAVDQVEDSEIAQLLPSDECTRPRAPKELREWVLAKCNLFAQRPNLREPVLLRHGRFKLFHEEIYPLSLFAVRRYGDRKDVFFVPNLDPGRDFDAQIREPSRTIPIEITSAHDPHEHLRMEYLIQHRYVPLTGALTVQGTKRKDRQIGVLLEYVNHEESRADHLTFIKTVAEGKKGLGRYGKNYELLIAVEDRWFEPNDAKEISAFVEHEVLTLPLEFGTVHLIGLTDRLFLSFEVRSSGV
jgi:hypothetical protein